MIKINENFLNLQNNYLFAMVKQKVQDYQKQYPHKKIINLGIGDVTLPLPEIITNSMKKACEEMSNKDTFKGYGPEQGYEFLREKIAKEDYQKNGIDISKEEIFVSDGAKCDTGNISDIFGISNKVAIPDPVYPVYLDSNVMAGRSGTYFSEIGQYEKIIYLPCNSKNEFIPELPKMQADIIYLCYPNNPTGTVLTKEQLKQWVDYAKEHHSIILYDSAYEKYITQENIPHSIYEVEGAKQVAIEFRSFSKTAGFTGVRCAYTVIPKDLVGYTEKGEEISIHSLWNRRTSSKFNGVSYITQKGAEAVYTEEGQKQIKMQVQYYLENARIIREGLQNAGFEVYGGVNAPYVWLKVPQGKTSWEFFDNLLEKANIVGTPGSGFGPSGEGYFRLTGFGTRENTQEAVKRVIL